MVYVKLPKSVLGLIADVNGRTVVEQIRSMIPGGGFIPIAVLMMDTTSEIRQIWFCRRKLLTWGRDAFLKR
jgi:hypothetical protein